ncbi:MAG: hypothetical protein LJF30_07965 [Acidobacteria bacterium]|jgi:hypothetical protein|nr:hypothetical protein [Acidobacteriota bacterium]
MLRVIAVGLAAGVALLITDALLNANPLAQRLYAAYGPIARSNVNALAGSLIDLAYGSILAVLFVALWSGLPGETRLVKGLSFGLMVWFLRVVMRVASDWVATTVPLSTHAYTLVGGLVQILLVAVLIAVLLPRPGLSGTT